MFYITFLSRALSFLLLIQSPQKRDILIVQCNKDEIFCKLHHRDRIVAVKKIPLLKQTCILP